MITDKQTRKVKYRLMLLNIKIFRVIALTVLASLLLVSCAQTVEQSISEPDTTEQIVDENTPSTNSMPESEATPQSEEVLGDVSNSVLGGMLTMDVYGEEVVGDIFAGNTLTLVNVWATWCPPCIAEMPELADLEKELREDGVGFLGVVTDIVNSDGSIAEEEVSVARAIMDNSGSEYPNVFVDEALYNELLTKVQNFPTTFFVDSNGEVVGEGYVGARNIDEWRTVVEDELAALEG